MQKKNDVKIFLSLILWTLAPSVYLLIRMNIVSVSGVDINILGQMEWFDLIDEIIRTAFMTPLYFILKGKEAKKNGFALLWSFGIYFLFTLVMSLYIGNIAAFMNAEYAPKYLLMQSVSMLIAFIGTFANLLFLIYEKYSFIAVLTAVKLIFLALFDCLLIPVYNDLGASYSEIIINTLIALISIVIIIKKKYAALGFCGRDFICSWIKQGAFAGLQIFLDNFIYAVIVCRMVNAVFESGNYWVANNFIWGWLLVPVTCMAQVIQKNSLPKITFHNVWKYAVVIVVLWGVSIPFWGFFVHDIMKADNYKDILNILYALVPYYSAYIAAAMLDAWFISKGKTQYLFIISVVVNIIYYGFMYLLFRAGVFTMNINFIINLFGLGMVLHMVISILLYLKSLKTSLTAF